MLEYLSNLLSADFLRPAALGLSLLAALVCALAYLRSDRRRSTIALRFLALTLIFLALADPAVRKVSSQEELVALLDVSKSVSPRAREALVSSLLGFVGGNKELVLNVVPFARQTARGVVEVRTGQSVDEILEAVERKASDLDSGETNVAAAINTISGRGEENSLLLLSDGFETSGNARQAAKLAAAKGVRVFPLIPNERAFHDDGLAIAGLQAPLTVNEGDLAELRLGVRNTRAEAGRAAVELWFDDKKLLTKEVVVNGNREVLLTATTPQNQGGLHRVRAVLRSEQSEKPQAEVHRWISVKTRDKLLLLSGAAEDRRVLRQLFTLKGYALEDIVADGNTDVPKTFEGYSGIVLNNVAERQLPQGFLSNLRGYVERGGGLIVIGGDRSFGLGGYIDTPLEEISPVKFVPPQTSKRRLNAAVVLVIDKSRSMAFEDKIGGAKAAALLALRSMQEEDFAGVIGFDAAPFPIIRLGPVPEVRATAEERLRHLTASGKTDLLPALAMARQSLGASSASRKHIIVLSDGKVPLAGNEYIEEMNRLRSLGISLSAIALGVEADAPFMQMLSQVGRGAFYHTLDPTRLPQIFLHDIKVATGERTLHEQKEFPVEIGPAGVVSTSIDRYPLLRGFVETVPKASAAIELVAKTAEKNFPLLASWAFGSGKVVVFTSDANGRWSLPWVGWEEFPRFWSEIVQGVEHAPETNSAQVDFDLRFSVNRKALTLDLALFDDKLRSESSPRVTAEVTLPGGETRTIAFVPQRKGRFLGVVENSRPGDLKLHISYGNVKFPPLGITLPGEVFGENPGQGIDVQNLSDLAYLSGGVINPSPGQVALAKRLSKTYTHLYLPLLVTAFFLIMAEAFIRELGLRVFAFPRGLFSRMLPRRGIYRSERRLAGISR